MDAWIKFSNLDNSWVDSYLALSCLSSLLCCSFNVWISKSRSNFSFSRSCFLRFSLCRFSSNIRLLTSCSTRALILVWKKSQWNKGSFTKTHRHLTFNIFLLIKIYTLYLDVGFIFLLWELYIYNVRCLWKNYLWEKYVIQKVIIHEKHTNPCMPFYFTDFHNVNKNKNGLGACCNDKRFKKRTFLQ